jgi:glutamate/aspartate transport system substrate-binding protein
MNTRTTQFLRSALMAAALLISGADVFAGSVMDRISQSGTINIGYRDDSLPFSYKNTENGPPLGYSIDVCVALAEAIKREAGAKSLSIKYVPVLGAARIPNVSEGKVDLECGNSTNTKARREKVAFSMPLYFASARLLVQNDSGITKFADLAGKTVAVEKGSTGEQIAAARQAKYPTMKVMIVETSDAGAAVVEKRIANAFMTDDILLHAFKAQSKEKLAVVGENLSVEPLAIMFNKSDRELAKLIEKEMFRLAFSGQLLTLYKKWFQTTVPQRSYNLSVTPNPLTSDVLVHPSSYVVDWVFL